MEILSLKKMVFDLAPTLVFSELYFFRSHSTDSRKHVGRISILISTKQSWNEILVILFVFFQAFLLQTYSVAIASGNSTVRI